MKKLILFLCFMLAVGGTYAQATKRESASRDAKSVTIYGATGTGTTVTRIGVLGDGSLQTSAGAETSTYAVANTDDSEPAYFGFLNAAGEWYILRETTLLTVETYEYARGASAYATAWTGRAGLSYNSYDTEF